jgi:hypothetical protein
VDIIVDIDGTLADITHRLHFIEGSPKNWDAFFDACEDDIPIIAICDLVASLRSDGHRIVYCSGRAERCRDKTQRWIYRHVGDPQNQVIYMRPDGDHRPDEVLKKEFLSLMRTAGIDPKLAIDDRKKVVDMWRAEGIICAQVAEGEF